MPFDIKEYNKKYYQNNKEERKEYNHTEIGIKSNRINTWKQRGVSQDYDFDEIHDIYVSTNFCHYCNTPLVQGNNGRGKKCLDHDHKTGEIRGILCAKCNTNDVLS